MNKRNDERITVIALVMITIVVIVTGVIIYKNISKKNSQENENIPQVQNEEYVQKLENGGKINVSEELNKNKKLDELEIRNIQFKEIEGITTLIADVINPGKSNVEEKRIKIEVIDKQGKTITNIKGRIDSVPAGGKVQLNIGVTADIANAYDIKISNR